MPNRVGLIYEDATKECAKRGSIILPIKDKDWHNFIITWAGAIIGSDFWLGLRKFRWYQYFDGSDAIPRPLVEDITVDLTYSDGSPFDPETQYAYGRRKFDSNCYYFKQSAEYDIIGTQCIKEKASVCLWLAHPCPDGYSYIGQLSDGRTCHGTPAVDAFYEATCDTGEDLLRNRWIPETTSLLDRFRYAYIHSNPVWTDARMSTEGDWYINVEAEEELQPKMDLEVYFDLRRPDFTWVPPLSVLDVNFTTDGCLEMTSTGLLNTRLKSECDTPQPTACQYKGYFIYSSCFCFCRHLFLSFELVHALESFL